MARTEDMTAKLRKRTAAMAEETGRPVIYLESFCNKEELAPVRYAYRHQRSRVARQGYE